MFVILQLLFRFYPGTACNATHAVAVAVLSVCLSDVCM